MSKKPTYKELEKRVKVLEKESSERNHVEAELRDSEERYRILFEESRDGVAISTKEGKFININQSALDLFGFTREEMKEINAKEIYANPEDLSKILIELKRNGFVRDYEVKIRKKGGKKIDALFSCTVKRVNNNKIVGFQGIIRDITERKQAEEALQQARDELERRVEERTAELARANEQLRLELNERKRVEKALRESQKNLQLLSSHLITAQEKERGRISIELHDELGQELMVLKLRLRAVEMKLGEDQVSIRKDCEKALNYIDHIVEDIRRLSRFLSPSILKDLGLSAALKWLVDEITEYYNIGVSVDMPEMNNLFSEEAQIMIYRIFQEGITNIGKHAQASHISITVKKEDGCVSFFVKDNGKGFDVKQIQAQNYTGKGLGLAAMNERIRMLGGSLKMWSQEGGGTQITFTVPIDEGRHRP